MLFFIKINKLHISFKHNGLQVTEKKNVFNIYLMEIGKAFQPLTILSILRAFE